MELTGLLADTLVEPFFFVVLNKVGKILDAKTTS